MADINKIRKAKEITNLECPNCGYIFKAAPRCPECGQKVITRTVMKERVDMVRAMEFICRCINDEEIIMSWLMCGVADGDINRETTDAEIYEEYCDSDTNFAELMDCFLRCMLRANKSGGLYCGEVVSNVGEEIE